MIYIKKEKEKYEAPGIYGAEYRNVEDTVGHQLKHISSRENLPRISESRRWILALSPSPACTTVTGSQAFPRADATHATTPWEIDP